MVATIAWFDSSADEQRRIREMTAQFARTPRHQPAS